MNAIQTRLMVLARALVALCLLGSLGLLGSLAAANEPAAPTIKIAVFDFELEDLSAASVLLGQSTTGSDSLHKVGEAARQELAKSGRYVVIDPSRDAAEFPKDGALKDCGGCESEVASRLGADQSLIGLVRRVSQTDYYVIVQVRDVHSGKVLAQEAANFAGGEEGWASGVRMLIDHQVLPVTATQSQAPAVCKVADVNPVSGHAECVDPQGAPVEHPPPREDKS
jgi:ABC-type sugar transport system substrate-binding protein